MRALRGNCWYDSMMRSCRPFSSCTEAGIQPLYVYYSTFWTKRPVFCRIACFSSCSLLLMTICRFSPAIGRRHGGTSYQPLLTGRWRRHAEK